MKIADSQRYKLGKWIEGDFVRDVIVLLILINAITMGLETSSTEYIPRHVLEWVDLFILGIFVIELGIKLYAFRWEFFKDAWNIFDLIIVIFSLISLTGGFSIIRTLRILRTLRLLRKLKKLRLIIDSLLQAIPSIAWVAVLLSLVFYIFGVIGTNLFGTEFPQWFGTLGRTLYTLFQVMTLESWSMGISRPVMEKFPYAFVFFIPFILIATYTTLNIFIAVVVNAMNEIHRFSDQKEVSEGKYLSPEQEADSSKFILQDNYLLKLEIDQLKSQLERMEYMMERVLLEKIEKQKEKEVENS